MTEDEMKETWCHRSYVSAVADGIGGGFEMQCMGSACAAFRSIGHFQSSQQAELPEGEGWVQVGGPFMTRWSRKVSTDCYCGLAGKP
jgi:hypothetical protein